VILWEIARASAFVAFGCYTLVVAWGVLLAGRAWRPAAPQLGFHRFLSSLGLTALVLHVSSVLLDHYARVPLTGLVGVGVRPAVMLGAAALWLALALPISFRLKRAGFMSQRSWRALHYFGYAVWGLALLHGIAAGTDSRSYPAIATYAGAGSIVAAAAWWRWLARTQPARAPT
jgi:methionine sulfoxide reductase heme-binding subunit